MKKAIYMLFSVVLLSNYAQAGGTYIGKVKPFFWGGGLYLTPINAQVYEKPACATRVNLRLQETDQNDPVFRNKYAMILSSWMAGKELKLIGNGECTHEGDEIIFVVQPN